ncbi:MAG: enolase C-terminal domain-like protein [Candidatus Bathyarchaeia archaeon]
MKIAKVEPYVFKVPLVKPFRTFLAEVKAKDHLIVKIETEDGNTGLGEIGPLPEFAGESGATCYSVTKELLAPAVLGQDPFNIERILARMDAAVKANHLAKSAMDFALHDLLGRILGIPVYKLLGGKYRERVPLCWAMGIRSPAEMAKEAEEAVAQGYKCLKAKIGLDPKMDIERLKAIRERVGDKIEIRADANQAYSPDTAITVIKKIEGMGLDLQYVEQPVPYWDIDGMAKVAKAVDTPILADESIFSMYDAVTIIKRGAADIINLKVGKVGGLNVSRKIASFAEAAGIPCMVGSMLEIWIGTAAGAHFAVAMKNVTYECELIGPPMYTFDVVKEGYRYVEGFLEVPEKPGFGMELDEEKLRKALTQT